jgi:integration host factor subunit beta
MTKSDLVELLANRFPSLRADDAKESVTIILETLTASLARGQRVEIRGFGSFSNNYRPPRIGRNPKTGEMVKVPAKAVPHFKAGKEMRERVDVNPSQHTQ